MNRIMIGVAATLLSAGCGDDGMTGDTGPADTGTGDTGVTDTGTADTSMPDGSMADGDAGATVTFDVEVVAIGASGLVPMADVYVRVDDALGGTRTQMTDSEGTVTFALPEGSEPWTVTAAKSDFAVVSILGVTGPLGAPIHLGGPGRRFLLPAGGTERMISGSITGRTLTADNTLFVNGWLFDPAIDFTANTYMGAFPDWTGAPNLRFLAVEWQDGPVNAVWVDVPRTGADLTGVDIAFPSPARTVTTTTMTVNLPTTGAVSAEGFVIGNPPPPVASLREGLVDYTVGWGTAPAVASGTTTWSIEAFEGDLAPTRVQMDLGPSSRTGGYQHIQVISDVVADAVIDVPGADRLETMGAPPLAGLALFVDAPMYDYVGASITGNGDGWFIYSYGTGTTWDDQTWPLLPEGLTLDAFFDTATTHEVHVFCVSYEGSIVPWNWSELGPMHALLSTRTLAL